MADSDEENRERTVAESSEEQQKEKTLAEIEAFDLVTEALTSLDAYQRSSDKSHLNEAKTALNKALEYLNKHNLTEGNSLYFRANYFLAMTNYLGGDESQGDESKEVSKSFLSFPGPIEDAAFSEAFYNEGATYYASESYGLAAAHFELARSFEPARYFRAATAPEVRLLAGAGVALSQAKTAKKLSLSEDKTKQQDAWDQAQGVKVLYREVRRELFFNFLRRLLGARHVERALSRRVGALIKQARKEVIHIPRPQKPVTVDKEPPTAQSGGIPT
ncbi:MAG TPA: hypothetical protein VF088_20585 [Pyrinomonadaceae bacterium]